MVGVSKAEFIRCMIALRSFAGASSTKIVKVFMAWRTEQYLESVACIATGVSGMSTTSGEAFIWPSPVAIHLALMPVAFSIRAAVSAFNDFVFPSNHCETPPGDVFVARARSAGDNPAASIANLILSFSAMAKLSQLFCSAHWELFI